MGFLNRIATDIGLMLHRPPRQQYAALCYRTGNQPDGIEVLVATSRDTGRWVIPKGWPMDGRKAHAVAEREAWEEAGVKGKAEKDALGTYRYAKKLDSGLTVTCRVQVHALAVAEMARNFREKGSRVLEWVSCEEAAARVNEPELKELFLAFPARMAARNATPLAAHK